MSWLSFLHFWLTIVTSINFGTFPLEFQLLERNHLALFTGLVDNEVEDFLVLNDKSLPEDG